MTLVLATLLVVLLAFMISMAIISKLVDNNPANNTISGYAWATAGTIALLDALINGSFLAIITAVFSFWNAYVAFKTKARILDEMKK